MGLVAYRLFDQFAAPRSARGARRQPTGSSAGSLLPAGEVAGPPPHLPGPFSAETVPWPPVGLVRGWRGLRWFLASLSVPRVVGPCADGKDACSEFPLSHVRLLTGNELAAARDAQHIATRRCPQGDLRHH